MTLIEPVRGVPDQLPPRAAAFDAVEATLLDVARAAGYERIRTPVFEHTEVFARGVGATTDIVQKEMYTFTDKGGRSLTLRPEGTAGVLRAALSAGVPKAGALPVKYAYAGEFFRHERPQAGRQRQFAQVGIEALGATDPYVDAEVVVLAWDAFVRLGLTDVTLRLNTLGDRADRPGYHAALNAYLDRFDDLPRDVAERRATNPLRAFDSKAPGMAERMADAPRIGDHVSAEARAHHQVVVHLLENEGVPVVHDPLLVRGLDYYTRTTFELQAGDLGAQNAVGGGGRYDGLAEDLGSSGPFPGVGWALGVDRTLLALERAGVAVPVAPRVRVFVVAVGQEEAAFSLVTALRRGGVPADATLDGRSVKAQFKAADRAGARWAFVLGADEVAAGEVTVKDLESGKQRRFGRDEVVALVR